MKLRVFFLSAALSTALLISAGCATVRTGPVESKLSETEAQVALGSDEVSPGDRVTLWENQCARPSQARKVVTPFCSRIKIGEATVIRVVDQDHSIIRVDPGVKFEEKMTVEKRG